METRLVSFNLILEKYLYLPNFTDTLMELQALYWHGLSIKIVLGKLILQHLALYVRVTLNGRHMVYFHLCL